MSALHSIGVFVAAAIGSLGAVAAGAVLAILLGVSDASPQVMPTFCTTWAEMADLLKSRFSEEPVGGGLVAETIVLHIFASPDGRTFTIVSVNAETGSACVLAAGQDWDPGVLRGHQG